MLGFGAISEWPISAAVGRSAVPSPELGGPAYMARLAFGADPQVALSIVTTVSVSIQVQALPAAKLECGRS